MSKTSANITGGRRSSRPAFVRIQRSGTTLRARISGPRLGEREAQIVAQEIHAAINAGGRLRHLVMDLTDVRTMSSIGLGMCIDVRNAARKRGAETVVIGLGQELADLFRMMKVDRLYVIVESEEELLARLAR